MLEKRWKPERNHVQQQNLKLEIVAAGQTKSTCEWHRCEELESGWKKNAEEQFHSSSRKIRDISSMRLFFFCKFLNWILACSRRGIVGKCRNWQQSARKLKETTNRIARGSRSAQLLLNFFILLYYQKRHYLLIRRMLWQAACPVNWGQE